MRAIHVFAIATALVLGAGAATLDRAQAQGLLEMSPPADSSSQSGRQTFEDIKVQTGTALPPKTGSAVFLNGRQLDRLLPPRSGRPPAARIKSK